MLQLPIFAALGMLISRPPNGHIAHKAQDDRILTNMDPFCSSRSYVLGPNAIAFCAAAAAAALNVATFFSIHGRTDVERVEETPV